MLSSESRNTLSKLLNKESYVPPAQGGAPGGGAPPVDPAMLAAAAGGGPPQGGGAPPMDPAMMAAAAGGPPQGAPAGPPPQGGGAPVGPAMMGGDPNAAPMDPTMGGQEEMPVPVVLDINDLKAILEEASQGGGKIEKLEKIVESMAKRMGIEVDEASENEESGSEEDKLPPYLQVPGTEEQQPPREPSIEDSAITPEAQQAAQQALSQSQQGNQPSQEELAGLVNMIQGA